ARGGALFAHPARASLRGPRGAPLLRNGRHRRLGADEGNGRARRGSLPHAGSRRRAALLGRAGGGGSQSALFHRDRAAARRSRSDEARSTGAYPGRRLQGNAGEDEGLVQGQLLNGSNRKKETQHMIELLESQAPEAVIKVVGDRDDGGVLDRAVGEDGEVRGAAAD